MPNSNLNVERPWSREPADVAAALQTDVQRGLASAEAAARLERFGPNVLHSEKPRGKVTIFLRQFADVMIGLLAAAAVISAAIGDWGDALLIGLILAANAVIGFLQEVKAENAVAALKKLTQPTARVWRDGAVLERPAEEVVPGDVIEVQSGDLAPADARLVEAAALSVNEAALTGESLPAEKSPRPVAADAPLPDRTSMIYAGTAVAAGHGKAIVVATGMGTELGDIARMLATTRADPTPLQQRLAQLSRRLAVAVVVVCVLVFVVGMLRGNASLQALFLTSVSLAVAAVPEGLPAVITVALALGSQRMARRHAIVRQLAAVETLGSVDVICSDKTGTLTQNRMTVEEIVPADDTPAARRRLLEAAALCGNVTIGGDGKLSGSPTETALVEAALRELQSLDELNRDWPREVEFPFSSERKRMSTLHRSSEGGRIVFVKGAVEQILRICTHAITGEQSEPLTDKRRKEFEQAADKLTRNGRRVLGLAMRPWDAQQPPASAEQVERDLTFLGLVGLVDPLRPESAAAIAKCRSAGVKATMITGDHRGTAEAIARQAGLLSEEDAAARSVSGHELDAWTDDELQARVADVRVFARVSPKHKLRIVKALQAGGSVTAMTGDGVNDAPALKQADIGVAMGITGTDVTKEAAKMILADDNFATIVAAVEQGRVVYDNIRKFVRYLLTTNTAEILVLFVAVALGLPLPLLPVHLLWINLVTDGLPALALGFEPPERDVMRRPPRRRDESIFAGGLVRDIFLYGGLMAAVCLGLYQWYLADSPVVEEDAAAYARTLVFVTLSLFQLFYVLGIRSATQPFYYGLARNWRLSVAVAVGIGVQMAVIYAPPLARIFHAMPLRAGDLAFAVTASTTAAVAVEFHKIMRARRGSALGEGL